MTTRVNVEQRSLLPFASPFPLRFAFGLLALAGTIACGGGGAADSDAEEGGGANGEGGDSAGGESAGGDGAGAAPVDCSGNPTTGEDKPDVVHQLEGVTVVTFAGSSTSGTIDGPSSSARLFNPVNVAIDGDGLLIADFDNGRIRRASADGTISTLTSQAGFARPFGLALAGNELFVQTDYDEHGESAGPTGAVMWSVDLSTGAATTIVTHAGRPRGMALLPSGELATADVEAMTLRILDIGGASFLDLAGSSGCPSFLDGSGDDVRFDTPYGMVVLPDGDMLVADMMNHRIRRVGRDGSVSTFAGDGIPDMIDGNADEARFNLPKDLAVDAAGNVYVSDVGNHRIRRIRTDGVVDTIAGDGTAGFADGSGDEARFYGQEGLDVTADGSTIYLADGTNGEPNQPYHRVRKISLP